MKAKKITAVVKHQIMRKTEDGLLKYFRFGMWAANSTEGREFDSVEEAAQFVLYNELHNALIIPTVRLNYDY
jgi:hypothetical protein